MEAHSDWYNDIDRRINTHKDVLSQKEQKKYKLDLLLRVAKRVADFSSQCGKCQMFQPEITRLTEDLAVLLQMPKERQNKEQRKNFFKTINNIIKHLQKQHKLVTEGQYMGMWTAVGSGIGVAIGAGLDNTGIGVAIGVAVGLAIGSYLDKKAKKEGRII